MTSTPFHSLSVIVFVGFIASGVAACEDSTDRKDNREGADGGGGADSALADDGTGNVATECDRAADKFLECYPDAETENTGEDEEPECTGNLEAVAKCANDASCEDIKAHLKGEQNDYGECVANATK